MPSRRLVVSHLRVHVSPQEGGSTVLKVVQGAQTVATVSAPTAQVTGAGFAATARWEGNEVDLSVTFDDQ